jgi:hypothetical protein
LAEIISVGRGNGRIQMLQMIGEVFWHVFRASVA